MPTFDPIFSAVQSAIFCPITQAGAGSGADPEAALIDLLAGRIAGAHKYDDPTTLFQNSNGTGAVTADNDPFGYATDITGNGYHGTQATAGERPLFVAGSGAVGDGSKWLTLGTIDPLGADKLTVVMCLQTSVTSNQGIFQHGSFNAGDAQIIVNGSTGGYIAAALGGSAGTSETVNSRSGPSASFKVVSAVFDLAGATALDEVKSRINGEVYGNGVQAAGPAGGGTLATRVANIMSWYGGTKLNGKLVRLAFVYHSVALTADELFTMEYWAGQGGGLSIISEFPPAGVVDYSMMMTYGQSLSLGGATGSPISTTRRFSNDYMLEGGTEPWATPSSYASLVPLAEGTKNISATDCGESPLSGMAEMLHELGFTRDTIGAVCGFPSLPISNLIAGQTQYNIAKDAVLQSWRRSREQFKHFKVLATNWMQGESGEIGSGYSTTLAGIQSSQNTDFKAITTQTEDVWLLSYQLEAPAIGLEHLDASDTAPFVRVYAPMYHIAHIGDGVHLTPAGSKIAGAYWALAYEAIVIDGNTAWKPLQCTGSSVAAQTIDLTYNRSGLTFDTTIVAAQTNQGFRVLDAGDNLLTISSVTIVGGNTVRIVVASGTPAKVYYGFDDPASTTRTSGNLRDSQGDTIVFDGGGLDYPMHNWAVLQSITL